MFLQLAELAEQLLDGIRVLNAGRGLTDHLLEPTHSAEEETEAKGALRWHIHQEAEGQGFVTSFAHFGLHQNSLKRKKSYFSILELRWIRVVSLSPSLVK